MAQLPKARSKTVDLQRKRALLTKLTQWQKQMAAKDVTVFVDADDGELRAHWKKSTSYHEQVYQANSTASSNSTTTINTSTDPTGRSYKDKPVNGSNSRVEGSLLTESSLSFIEYHCYQSAIDSVQPETHQGSSKLSIAPVFLYAGSAPMIRSCGSMAESARYTIQGQAKFDEAEDFLRGVGAQFELPLHWWTHQAYQATIEVET